MSCARVAAAAAALGGAVLLASVGCAGIGGDCAEVITFGERRYVGAAVEEDGAFAPKELVGYARTDPCGGDRYGEQRSLVSIAGLAPEVALLDGERDDRFYVAAGRCVDAEEWDGLATCLRQRLSFEDRWYSRTVLDGVGRGRELGTGILYRGLESVPVELAALRSVPPERALVSAGEPRVVWVADGSCTEEASERLESCLRSGL